MDAANLTASWVSAIVTAVGLGSLVTQAATIRNQLDPFHGIRGEDQLGIWVRNQRLLRWHELNRDAPNGPVIKANLHACLGQSTIHLSRKPLYPIGKSSWTMLLAVFHPMPVKIEGWHPTSVKFETEKDAVSAAAHDGAVSSNVPATSTRSNTSIQTRWLERLEGTPLICHRGKASTTISRTTLITFLLLSQTRMIYRYAEASGLRMAYAGYNGYYLIEWPIGMKGTLLFEEHESHSHGTDRYPETFPRRPRKCVEMGVGVIDNTASNGRLVAFSGRKPTGSYVLQLLPKRFGAQTSSAGLYNKIGGQAHEVDYLFRRPLAETEGLDALTDTMEFSVPSLTAGSYARLFLGLTEVRAVVTCLDNIPWSQLGWSIHRGMKDVLHGYGKTTLATYRTALAETLRVAVQTNEFALAREGWEVNFIQDSMADQAASAILGGNTCSGDGCRIVSAAALLLCENKDEAALDHTEFWSNHLQFSHEGKAVYPIEPLPADTVIALVKLLFVVWSQEFDYEIYHCLPSELIVL